MTPRSRKPVIMGGAMVGISGENYHKNIMNYMKDDGCGVAPSIDGIDDKHNLSASLLKSKSESDLLPAFSLPDEMAFDETKMPKSTSEETLSTPFR